MKGLQKLVLVVLVGAVAMGCETEEEGTAPDEPVAENDAAECLQGEPFVDDGTIPASGTETGNADRISGLRWESHDGCDRFVIDLADEDGAPADSIGAVSAEVLRDLGVVRISLRDVEWVDPDATDATIDAPLARAAYSVWSPDGRWVFVDLHLADEAEAHATTLKDPARVVVDLRPGGAEIPQPAPTEDHVVVLEPRPGEATYPLTVTGYARTFEANVVARIEQGGEQVDETFTTATAWADAWGYFTMTFADGPDGPIVLHVGEHSAKDGTWEGVAVDLEMESR